MIYFYGYRNLNLNLNVSEAIGYLKEQGLTQQELAFALEVSQPTISRWERGRSNPNRKVLGTIASLMEDHYETSGFLDY
jgi:transcriptional regulator with XRE-family HTH domain